MTVLKISLLNENATLPRYASEGAAGLDLYAAESVPLFRLDPKWVSTGIAVEVPEGYELQIRPRSGLAGKGEVLIANAPGTVDSDYRGEIKVSAMTLKTMYVIDKGQRFAQMVLAKVERAEVDVTEVLTPTDRGEDGFGSTGVRDD